MEIASSTLALQTLLYVTSSSGAIEELVKTCVDHLLELKAIPRLVEFIFEFSSDCAKCSNSTKKIINTTLAILANLTRTERGALELVGTTLPEEAVYNNNNTTTTHPNEEEEEVDGKVKEEVEPRIALLEDDDVERKKNRIHNTNKNEKHVRIKPSMELLFDRFMKTNQNNHTNNATTTGGSPLLSLLYEQDPYQHFASLLMNATQVKGGRQFITRLPRGAKTSKTTTTTTTTHENKKDAQQQSPSLSVLQRLLPILRQKHNDNTTNNHNSTNPFRRRGIAGMIRNICLDRDDDHSWWLLHICEVLTPLLLPLMGPEELDLEDKKGMDADLWLEGPEQHRDLDAVTRLYCVEALLALLASGRMSRKTLRKAQTYTVLKHCDMVEDNEQVSDRIQECVNFLRRDEEGSYEGSSDHQIYKSTIDSNDDTNDITTTTNDNNDNKVIAGLLTADPSIPIQSHDNENFDDVD